MMGMFAATVITGFSFADAPSSMANSAVSPIELVG
jgi:hypothetical protein